MCVSVARVYLGAWLIQKVFMSQIYVGCCKQVYDSPSVCWLLYATTKECISGGKERNIWTVSKTLRHTCWKGHTVLSIYIYIGPKHDETHFTFYTHVHNNALVTCSWPSGAISKRIRTIRLRWQSISAAPVGASPQSTARRRSTTCWGRTTPWKSSSLRWCCALCSWNQENEWENGFAKTIYTSIEWQSYFRGRLFTDFVFANLQKNAVIDSLQEQVSNAKDKLLHLVAASQPAELQDLDSSNTNLNSSSTQTTELQYDGLCASSLPQRDAESQLSQPRPSSPLATAAEATAPSSGPANAHNFSTELAASSPPPKGIYSDNWSGCSLSPGPTGGGTLASRTGTTLKQPLSHQPIGFLRTSEETVNFVTSLQSSQGINPFHRGQTARPSGFVSSEQLQEILQELSIDAVETSLRSPGQMSRTSTHIKFPEPTTLSPLSLRTPRSPRPPAVFRYPSISPYTMRKRRPPFYSSRRGLACFHTGLEAVGHRQVKNRCENQNQGKHSDGIAVSDTFLQGEDNSEQQEVKEDDEGENGAIRGHKRCVSKSHQCSALPSSKHGYTFTPAVDAGGNTEQHHRHVRDSCWSWDSESSSSTDYCYYHRPYCESCLQRGSLMSSESSSDSSDSEYEGYSSLYRSPHPVVFKEDIKPTFVWPKVYSTLHVVTTECAWNKGNTEQLKRGIVFFNSQNNVFYFLIMYLKMLLVGNFFYNLKKSY